MASSPRQLVATRQRVSHHVQCSRLVLNHEIKPQQFARPLMLRYGREALIQEEAEAAMICANHKPTSPKIRAPVSNRLDQPNEFAFVRRERSMAGRNGLAKESHRPRALMQHCAEPRPRCITVDDVGPGEVWELEYRRTGEGVLKVLERAGSVRAPAEDVLP